MGIARASTLDHWQYLLAIEDDLIQLSRYVDFSGNDQTYSIEIARLLMAAAAESDVVLKQLCARWEPSAGASSIGAYHAVVDSQGKGLKDFEVIIPRFGLQLKPWSSWEQDKPPLWWTATNKVKHERHEHFAKATLKNCLNAVAGLFVSVLYLYPSEARNGELVPPTRLLDIPPQHSGGEFHGRWGAIPMVVLPEGV